MADVILDYASHFRILVLDSMVLWTTPCWSDILFCIKVCMTNFSHYAEYKVFRRHIGQTFIESYHLWPMYWQSSVSPDVAWRFRIFLSFSAKSRRSVHVVLCITNSEFSLTDGIQVQPPRFVTHPSSSASMVNEGRTKILQCHALGKSK